MASLVSTLDHIVIVANRLEEGADACEGMLGVRPQKGGEHARLGTHNFLLNLAHGAYLEIIAINPAAPKPAFPRWFGMDRRTQGSKAGGGLHLTTFVVRTNDITAASNNLPALGPVCDMQRDALHWQITIPADGALVESGAVPTVIQWPDGVHPTRSMSDSGIQLACLEIRHPQPAHLETLWARIGLHVDHRLRILPCAADAAPRLTAHLLTPSGTVTLC